MKKIIITSIIILLVTGCILQKEINNGIVTNAGAIKFSDYAESLSSPLKFKKNLYDKKFILMGAYGAKFFNANNLNKTDYIKYEVSTLHPDIIKVNGKVHFVAGGGGFGKVGLMNERGKLLWEYLPNPKLHPFDMVGGDLNNDGVPEFYVATNDGLHILDVNGKLHKKINSLWINDVEICIYNNRNVVAGISDGVFYFWGYEGVLLKKIKLEQNFSRFTIVNWPNTNHLLTKAGKFIYLYDLEGNLLFKRNLGIRIYAISGMPVNLMGNEAPYLAILSNYSSQYNKSLLSILSHGGDIIYKEVLCSTQALSTIKSEFKKKEDLIVGACPKVKKYYIGNRK